MPRSRGDKEYILPVKGLNTEANLLHFPQEFSPDLLNMEVDYSPQVVRPRKGIKTAANPKQVATRNTNDHKVGISSFLWETVNGDPDKNFVVLQVGRYIFFFDDDGITDPTASVFLKVIDLNESLSGTSKGTLVLLEAIRINYVNIKGKLLVCSEQIEPTLIQYDGTDITASSLALKQRDILGVSDGLEVDEHSSSLTDDHKYNLFNQGWHKQRRLASGSKTESDPIVEYNTQNSEYPSNADVVWVGMVDDAGDLIFDAELLKDSTFGSSPAARGHYVVGIFNIDRAAILADPLASGGSGGGSSSGGGSGGGPDDGTGKPPIDDPF